MLLILVLYFLVPLQIKSKNIRELRIGGLFQDDEEEIAFRVGANILNDNFYNSPFRLVPSTARVHHYDAFNVLSNACSLLEKGVIGMFGPSSVHSSSFMSTIFDSKEIPHIETHGDSKFVRNNCLLNLYPHPSILSSAFVDLVVNFKWDKVIVLYENDASLSRVGPLLSLNTDYGCMVTLKQLKPETPRNYRRMLTNLKMTGETNFVLDCSIGILEEVLRQAQQVGMMTENYNYIITNLDMQTIDFEQFQYGGTNITGIRLINPEDDYVNLVTKNIYKTKLQLGKESEFTGVITVKTALIVDAVKLFYEAVMDLTHSGKLLINTQPVHCNKTDSWRNGQTIINYMRGKSIKGLTGVVQFDSEGFRRDFVLEIIDLSEIGLSKIASWHPHKGLNFTRIPLPKISIADEGSLINKTFVVIMCLNEPYGMYRDTTEHLVGNDRFEGFSIDLIEELSKMLGFNYTIIIEESRMNGNFDPLTKEWNGLVGSIIRGKADLAIADLTVTAERERVVDFTLQFMNLGISILYRKPEPVPPSLFMFSSPFSNSVWLMLVVAYFVVSLAFFVMGRLSPSEWTNPFPCIEEPKYLVNQFSIRNSFWFTMGSLMQQGSEIAPIGVSTRTASGVWWFFTLIIVSSYTANLAAFLTVETLVTSFGNLDELAAQKEIKYGAQKGGATANFFKDAPEGSVRKKIWNYMASNNNLMTTSNDQGVARVEKENYAYFMESTTIEYVIERHCTLARVGNLLDEKGYAIAMKKNSTYRNDLSTAILKLQETGRLAALKVKWWKEKRGAGNCVVSDNSGINICYFQSKLELHLPKRRDSK